ncbi:MAG TPA: bifunctional glutamate N-acetyltransferase/amino-acid acetyltransferase ArgJ [Dehalococcoidia bacterium]|nr:bifunctional glutamate N-acetyltransferase/amino-acid acetyltransferase ArgJ [Dehalococcoidia bacterium]
MTQATQTTASVQEIPDGSVTTPAGFQAGATHAGVKYQDTARHDVGLLYSERPCVAAGMFTKSSVVGAPVIVSKEHLADGSARAIVANSGIANVATGAEGLQAARAMAEQAGGKLGIAASEVLVASTGVIGWQLPMDRIARGIDAITLASDGGMDLARAIMTTDTRPKHAAAAFVFGGRRYHVGGIAKGSGMIHPDMGTMFGFLTSDVPVAPELIRPLLRSVVDETFNMVSVDGDTSTSDTVVLLANGAGGGAPFTPGSAGAEALRAALFATSRSLARQIAADGEGASKLIEVRISGAASVEEARRAARTVSVSPLMKSAVYGNDFNWGRVMMAVGRSYVAIDLDRAEVRIGDVIAYACGAPRAVDEQTALDALKGPEVVIAVQLGVGEAAATAWGCDLTEEYVRINAEYTT